MRSAPRLIWSPSAASSSRSSSVARSAASRAASGSSEIPHVHARHEHAAAGEDLDELLLREAAQRLAHRRPADAEALDERPLVDQGSRGKLKGDDQLADRDVGAVGERGSLHRALHTDILLICRWLPPAVL